MSTEATPKPNTMEVRRGFNKDGRDVTVPTFRKTWGSLKRLQYWAGLATHDTGIAIQVTKDTYGYAVTVGEGYSCETAMALDYEAAYYLIRGAVLGSIQAGVLADG